MYYHASPIKGIKVLEPRISNHNIPLVYFSTKRENTFVYLSNAVEKLCKEKGFIYEGVLRLYNRVFSNGINKQYAVEMVRIVKKYNRFYGTIMALQVFSTLFLEKILPKKLARQIPMALYLFNLDKRKKNISKRIKPIF